MNTPQSDPIPGMGIPTAFMSTDTGKPIDHCLVCETYLLDGDTMYMIEKAVRNYPAMETTEVIIEYAICMDCAFRMNESLSQESRDRIAAYFENHTDLMARRNALLNEKSDIRSWIDHCVIKHTPIAASAEYQLVGQFQGTRMLLTTMPFALSFEAIDEINALMSEKSLGEIDDFIGKYFSGPPEVAALLKRKFILL
ncbi:MAG TPA: hypothetical protein VD816_13570 [Ohtaekwangia sp.]|nr:hypothetical protein [Ohtaekwangia sp.]